MQSEIKKNTQGTNSEGKETGTQINDLDVGTFKVFLQVPKPFLIFLNSYFFVLFWLNVYFFCSKSLI